MIFMPLRQRDQLYTSPDGSVTAEILQLGFVDDVNNRTNLPWQRQDDPHAQVCALIDQASEDNQLWNNLMESVNQQLELTKCKYHVMHYDFKPSGEPQMVIEQQPPTHLTVTNAANQPVHITHVPSDKALQYLGCHKCPMNQHKQEQVLNPNAKTLPARSLAVI